MGLRNMLILLAIGFVAVVVLGVFVILDSGAPPPDKEPGLVFPVKDAMNRTIRDLATRIEIARGKEAVVLEKAGALEWRLKKPVDARADRSAVLSLLDALNGLQLKAEPVTVAEGDWAKYGLKEPRIAATFWLGDDARSFAIGSEAPPAASGKRAYIRLGDDARALVVEKDFVERLDKGVDKLEKPEDAAKWVAAFRDKRVFDRARDPQKAKTLRVVTASRTLELERADKAWGIKSPVADLADASKVSSLLSKASSLDAEKFVSEDAAKLAECGLDKPQLTCEVKAEDGTMMKLLVGKEATEKDHLYAKRGEEPSIFTIKKDFLTDMEPKLEDVRDRKVATFEESDVTAAEVTRGKDAWAVAREGKDKDWRLTKPRDAKAHQSAAGDLVRHLGKLRVARWIDDPKDPANKLMESPEAVVTLIRAAKGKPLPPVKLEFSAIVKKEKEAPKDAEKPKDDKAKKEPEKPKEKEFEEGRYVRRDDQKALLYVVAGKATDGAPFDEKDSIEGLNALGKGIEKGHLALLDRKVLDFKEADVARLAIERDGKVVALEKKDGDWKLTSPAKLDADKSSVSKILNAMDDLSADEYLAEKPAPEDLKRYGLDAPALRLTATIEEAVADAKKDDAKADEKKKEEPKPDKKTYTKTLLVSRKAEGKTYGMEQGGTLVFTIGSFDADNLRTEAISTTLGEFAEADATSLTLAPRGKPEIVIEKVKDTWAITKPKKAEADQDAVKKVLDALHDLKGLRCLDYDAQKLSDYGLDPAETVVTVKIDKKPDLVLKLGKPIADEKDTPGSAAIKGDAKQVFLVAKNKVEDIAKSLSDLEKKPEPPKKEEPKKEEPKKEEPKAKENAPKAK